MDPIQIQWNLLSQVGLQTQFAEVCLFTSIKNIPLTRVFRDNYLEQLSDWQISPDAPLAKACAEVLSSQVSCQIAGFAPVSPHEIAALLPDDSFSSQEQGLLAWQQKSSSDLASLLTQMKELGQFYHLVWIEAWKESNSSASGSFSGSSSEFSSDAFFSPENLFPILESFAKLYPVLIHLLWSEVPTGTFESPRVISYFHPQDDLLHVKAAVKGSSQDIGCNWKYMEISSPALDSSSQASAQSKNINTIANEGFSFLSEGVCSHGGFIDTQITLDYMEGVLRANLLTLFKNAKSKRKRLTYDSNGFAMIEMTVKNTLLRFAQQDRFIKTFGSQEEKPAGFENQDFAFLLHPLRLDTISPEDQAKRHVPLEIELQLSGNVNTIKIQADVEV